MAMMKTIATLCTGGGGVEISAKMAGLTPLWGIEYDDDIANVARANGLHVITADVCEVDPADCERPDVLHASPPCPNFSTANQGGEESSEDVAIAEAVARFVDALRPQVFTLENVYMYRKSESWELIAKTLNRCGYWFDLAHVNTADFGVPQTRKRMIVRARLGQMVPHLPPPEPWVGWYSSIQDLIPTLPESEFAPWQLERLPELATTTMVTNAGNQPNGHIDRQPVQKAFLVSDQSANAGSGVQIRDDGEPSVTVRAGGAMPRAWLSQGRVVQMTPRALARFQSFPDWYELPESRTLACKVIGNAVPPLLYEKLIRQLV